MSKTDCLVVADFSQIELRVLAHFTQDPNLIAGYVAGLDLHTLTASKAYHVAEKDVTPLQRSLGKNVNFSVCFGVTPRTLVEKYNVPNEKEGQALIDGFYAAYPTVAPWQEKQLRDARARRPPHVRSILGRRRRLGALMSMKYGERAGAERQAINFIIQGSAADINKLALIKCHRALREENLKARIILSVHDEIVTLTPKKEANQVEDLIRTNMESAYELQGLPLTVDVKQVERWNDAK